MVSIAKDAAFQLYKAVYAVLTQDDELRFLLGSTLEDPKVYQTATDFQSTAALRNDRWLTFNIVSDRPAPVEQIQDVRSMILDVHVWERGTGSDNADNIEARVRALLDDTNIATSELFVWQNYATGYSKTFEIVPGVWHIISTYQIMCMAVRQDA